MIVRIASEGQFELAEDQVARLNELDNAAVAAVEARDGERFRRLWAELIALVESEGRPLADDELVPSDVIFPPRDVSLEEAEREFTGDGLIPD